MMLKCPGCGTDILVRTQLSTSQQGKTFVCRGCGHWYLGYPSVPVKCEFCGESDLVERESGRPACPDCTRRMFTADDEVRKGGAYWSCDGCGAEGYLTRAHPIAFRLRVLHNIQPPAGLVLKMGKCPYCKERPASEQRIRGVEFDVLQIDEVVPR